MEYLKIFTDFARSIEPLDDAERGRLFSAMLAYADSGAVPDLPGNERFLWPTARLHIDREMECVNKKRASGSIGGKIRQTNASAAEKGQAPSSTFKQSQAPSSSKDKDKDKEKDKDNSSPPGGGDVSRPRGPYANVYLTDQELETFRAEYPDADEHIRHMGEYLASTGKTYQNYLAALRRWARKDGADKPPDREAQRDAWIKKYIRRNDETEAQRDAWMKEQIRLRDKTETEEDTS